MKVKRFNHVLGAVVLMSTLHSSAMNQLQKVELHNGQIERDHNLLQQIEHAKLICYFKNKPLIQHLQTTKKANGWESQTYLIMHAECNPVAQKALEQIGMQQYEHFYIASEKVDKPMLALKLEIGYDPEQISLNHDTFDAITTQKGVLFRLNNRPLLQRLAIQERPLLQLAYCSMDKPALVGIDCGHGAQDSGAVCNGLIEKELTLQLGLTLAQMLNEKGITTIMTRQDDRAVALHERTSMMNRRGVDLLISIHANSAPSAHVYGIETFCAHPQLLQPQSTIAHEEQLRTCLNQRFKQTEKLAQYVHTQVLQAAHHETYIPIDRHVRHASSQILLGSNMPTILIEVGFLTNEAEAKKLADSSFQRQLARGMCQGIVDFLSKNKQTA